MSRHINNIPWFKYLCAIPEMVELKFIKIDHNTQNTPTTIIIK